MGGEALKSRFIAHEAMDIDQEKLLLRPGDRVCRVPRRFVLLDRIHLASRSRSTNPRLMVIESSLVAETTE